MFNNHVYTFLFVNTENLDFIECFQKAKVLRFLSFEFVSYFDIRISNLVAAKGCAKFFVVKLFLVAALPHYDICSF